MKMLEYKENRYATEPRPISWFARLCPTLAFYGPFVRTVFRSSALARKGQYGDEEWADSSFDILRSYENIGACVEISGIEHIRDLEEPCVIIGNHVSMLETVVLPCIVRQFRKVTFVVKDTLLTYPVFRHVMRSRDPIAVTRTNPRLDFKSVMDGGVERLDKGISVIVFPQTTRTSVFKPEEFNSIGVKLAHKAGVPVVPLALLTDGWENGALIKDFGRINPAKKARFCFGEPMRVQKRGAEEHQKIVDFISGKLREWQSGAHVS